MQKNLLETRQRGLLPSRAGSRSRLSNSLDKESLGFSTKKQKKKINQHMRNFADLPSYSQRCLLNRHASNSLTSSTSQNHTTFLLIPSPAFFCSHSTQEGTTTVLLRVPTGVMLPFQRAQPPELCIFLGTVKHLQRRYSVMATVLNVQPSATCIVMSPFSMAQSSTSSSRHSSAHEQDWPGCLAAPVTFWPS